MTPLDHLAAAAVAYDEAKKTARWAVTIENARNDLLAAACAYADSIPTALRKRHEQVKIPDLR